MSNLSRKPIFTFTSLTDTGIDQVTEKSVIFLEELNKFYFLDTVQGLGSTSTLQDAISNSNLIDFNAGEQWQSLSADFNVNEPVLSIDYDGGEKLITLNFIAIEKDDDIGSYLNYHGSASFLIPSGISTDTPYIYTKQVNVTLENGASNILDLSITLHNTESNKIELFFPLVNISNGFAKVSMDYLIADSNTGLTTGDLNWSPLERLFHMEVTSSSEPQLLTDGTLIINETSSGSGVYDVYDKWRSTPPTYVKFNKSDTTRYDVTQVTVKKTDSLTSMNEMFYGGETRTGTFSYTYYAMENLQEIIFENTCNTSNVTDVGACFNRCYGLTNLDITIWNTANVINMASLFYRCDSLTSVDISNFDTSNVTSFYQIFSSNGLTDIIGLNNLNTENATNMLFAFYNSKLTEIDISNWSVASTTDMYGVFSGATSATKIKMPNDMISVKPAARMNLLFYNCSSLTCLNLLDTTNATDTTDMFTNCDNLTAPDATAQNDLLNGTEWINIDGCGDTASSFFMKIISNMDSGTEPPLESDSPVIITDHGSGIFTVINDITSGNPTYVKVKDVPESQDILEAYVYKTDTITDMSYMFGNSVNYLQYLRYVEFMDTCDTSNVTTFESMYESAGYSSWIFTIKMDNCDTSNVTTMKDMFKNAAYNGVSFNMGIENFNTSNVTNMGGIFSGFAQNTDSTVDVELNLNNWDVSNVTDFSSAFSYFGNNSQNVTINIDQWDTGSATTFYNMFGHCAQHAQSFNFDISAWDTGSLTSLTYTFSDCAADITDFNLYLGDWDCTNIAYYYNTFHNYPGTWLVLPKNMTTVKPAAYMKQMFNNAANLTCLNLLDTTNATDTTDMFYGCVSLTAPDSTTQSDLLNGASWTNPDPCPLTFEMVITTSSQPVLISDDSLKYIDNGDGTWTIRNNENNPKLPSYVKFDQNEANNDDITRIEVNRTDSLTTMSGMFDSGYEPPVIW